MYKEQTDIASAKAWFVDQGFPARVFDRLVQTVGALKTFDLGICTEDDMKSAGLSPLQIRRFMMLQSEQLLGKVSEAKLKTQIDELRNAVRTDTLPLESGKHILQAIMAKEAKRTGANAQVMLDIEISKWGITGATDMLSCPDFFSRR